jgi:V/A-type H+-transporting ATPase subunit B
MKFEIEYSTIENVAGPLIVVGKVRNAEYNEIVRIKLPSGEERLGQVLDTSDTQAIVQVFGPTDGINIDKTTVSFLGETFKVGVGEEMLGRVFDGQGRPRDSGARVAAQEQRDINGAPINPVARVHRR